jgi:sugar transferase (PEP-CTERM/EpsH1 system associated)
MGALVQQVMAAGRFDVLHVEDIHMAQYAARQAGVRTVLDLHNVDSWRMRRFARHQRNPLTRLYALLTARKLARYEANIASAYDLVLACSEDDRALLSAGGVQADVLVVPNGVDISRFAPQPAPSKPRHLVFVGRMDYEPNADAVLFFCRYILPLVRAAHDDVTFAVVGQHPSRAVKALSSIPGVTVTGFVDDVRPHVADAAVVVVPLRYGSGTRLKILEAMAMGKAVVSTTVGCEGIRAVSGEEIVLADEAPAFASAVVRLLNSQTARLDLGQRARQRAVSDYSWTRIGTYLLAAYDGLLPRPGQHPSRHSPAAFSVQPRAATTDQAR